RRTYLRATGAQRIALTCQAARRCRKDRWCRPGQCAGPLEGELRRALPAWRARSRSRLRPLRLAHHRQKAQDLIEVLGLQPGQLACRELHTIVNLVVFGIYEPCDGDIVRARERRKFFRADTPSPCLNL